MKGWGSYSAEPKTEWLKDGRKMKLLEQVTYTDPAAKVWIAPAGWIVDGASIPRAFWSVIGGPLEGQYRNASVFHDVACDQKSQPWKTVHRMFYNAMRCSGVNEIKAKIMYYAVYNFGPCWGLGYAVMRMFGAVARQKLAAERLSTSDIAQISKWIERNNPDLGEIESNPVKPMAARGN